MSDPAKAEPAASLPAPASVAELAELARGAGLRRVAILAWRDIDDPEAGGSELHAHEVATRWATAGIDVVVRTSSVAGRAVLVEREGYRVVRRSGRYAVFVTGPMELTAGRLGPLDGLVEVWNGMPFLSPLWCRLPRVVFLHHVHGEMWPMTLPSPLAEAGNLLESRLAPPLYRRSRIVTLSESSREEIVRLPGVRSGPCQRRATGNRPVLLARRFTGRPAARGGRRSSRARQELSKADRDPGACPRADPFPRDRHRRRRIGAVEPRGEAAGAWRGRLREPPRPGGPGRARRLVPPSVGRSVDVDARRMGLDRERGCGLRDDGGRHADPRTRRRDRPRHHGHAGRSGRGPRTPARNGPP